MKKLISILIPTYNQTNIFEKIIALYSNNPKVKIIVSDDSDNLKIKEKIKAICTVCGKPATKTYRIKASGSRVQVGSMGMYEPRCLEHWEPK